MIKTHEVFGNEKITAEINWENSVMPCKKIRFSIDGKTAVMDKGDLFALLTIIATNEEQERLMIVKHEEVVGVRKMLKVRTTKAVPEGGEINFPMTQYVSRNVFDKMLEVGAVKPEDMITLEEAESRMKPVEKVDIDA